MECDALAVQVEKIRRMADEVTRLIREAEGMGGEHMVLMLSQALMPLGEDGLDVASRVVSLLNEVMADQIGREHGAWSALLGCLLERGPFRYTSQYGAVTWCRLLKGSRPVVAVSRPGWTVTLTLDGRSPGGRSIELKQWWGRGPNAVLFPEEADRFRPLVSDALEVDHPTAAEVDLYTDLLCVVTPHAEVEGEWTSPENLSRHLQGVREAVRLLRETVKAMTQAGWLCVPSVPAIPSSHSLRSA